jgi:hypothetical protein
MRRAFTFLLSVDRFLLLLIAVVAAASLLPVRGAAARWTDMAADLAIALLRSCRVPPSCKGSATCACMRWFSHRPICCSR